MALTVKNLNKRYAEKVLYSDFNIEFEEGTITCILGPSGCGKTTLLNILGGVNAPDSGELEGFGQKVASYIFQEPRLLPWKSVRDNIEFVLPRDLPALERSKEADRLIKNVELDGYADYYPSQLSGGMCQRVSIARAFACHSDIILMDEPLKGLDIVLKENMIKWFSQSWQTDKRTVIFVTHDVDEALLLGNDIYVLGRSPVEIVAHVSIAGHAGDRTGEEPHLKKLKQSLYLALGSTVNTKTEE